MWEELSRGLQVAWVLRRWDTLYDHADCLHTQPLSGLIVDNVIQTPLMNDGVNREAVRSLNIVNKRVLR
jgi:hypothetical protein